MKRLILMRHADAQLEALYKTDRERPLSPQGLKELDCVHKNLKEYVSAVSLVLCSNAKRARQTFDGIQAIFPPHVECIFEDRLYHASPDILAECLHEVDEKHQTVLLIGHNPGVSEWLKLCLRATHQIDISSYVSTATAIIFEGPLERWSKLKPSLLRLQVILNAKED